jgi:haloalkane dehalogenase
MKILRTPDAQFANLPDFPWAPQYMTVRDEDGTDIRIHCIDEGPRDAPPILLMHGNPTWAYLYRHMIPGLLATGRRVIAVDLVGCGRSDKPAEKSDYTLARHYDWMGKWLTQMDLTDITLFCQDWGGTIGIYLAAQHPERFARVIASNTGLPLGEGESDFMKMWVGMMRAATAFPWQMLEGGMQRKLTEGEVAAYRAPFPSTEYEADLRSSLPDPVRRPRSGRPGMGQAGTGAHSGRGRPEAPEHSHGEPFHPGRRAGRTARPHPSLP